jgi:predicted nucleotidyltransferase
MRGHEPGASDMKPSEALQAKRAELHALATRYGVLRPRIFGSVIHGTDVEGSDLDILLIFP